MLGQKTGYGIRIERLSDLCCICYMNVHIVIKKKHMSLQKILYNILITKQMKIVKKLQILTSSKLLRRQ